MTPNRDILLMFRHRMMSDADMETAVTQLHRLLFFTERPDNFAAAHEVFDINRYRIVKKIAEIKKMMRTGKFNKPFIFFFNKN